MPWRGIHFQSSGRWATCLKPWRITWRCLGWGAEDGKTETFTPGSGCCSAWSAQRRRPPTPSTSTNSTGSIGITSSWPILIASRSCGAAVHFAEAGDFSPVEFQRTLYGGDDCPARNLAPAIHRHSFAGRDGATRGSRSHSRTVFCPKADLALLSCIHLRHRSGSARTPIRENLAIFSTPTRAVLSELAGRVRAHTGKRPLLMIFKTRINEIKVRDGRKWKGLVSSHPHCAHGFALRPGL